MGRNSSGVRGGMQPGDSTYKGKVAKVQDLAKMKDPEMYKAAGEAISRYHSVMGVRQKKVKLAELSDGTLGVHLTVDGVSEGVYLNKRHFNAGAKEVKAVTRKGYDSGWSTRTNKPIAHTITHELAHATWNNHLRGANHKAAGNEIKRLYNSWLKDTSKKGYGKYARTNVNEFWAETVTKAVHGTSDKYTQEVKRIAKRYKL